ncbi:hypothetical protein AYO43_01840 [Nitrospira sp. SCGC AG-212-E16]|nr:hypothetical protein AYO43_01840 [Nitrospira sp. SCGC AG-212-E16]
MTEAKDTGLAAWVAGVDELLLGDALCLDTAGPLTLARDSRFGALSDEAGPQLTSPAKSTTLKSSLMRGGSRCRYVCDGGMSSDVLVAVMIGNWEQFK